MQHRGPRRQGQAPVDDGDVRSTDGESRARRRGYDARIVAPERPDVGIRHVERRRLLHVRRCVQDAAVTCLQPPAVRDAYLDGVVADPCQRVRRQGVRKAGHVAADDAARAGDLHRGRRPHRRQMQPPRAVVRKVRPAPLENTAPVDIHLRELGGQRVAGVHVAPVAPQPRARFTDGAVGEDRRVDEPLSERRLQGGAVGVHPPDLTVV